MSSQNISPPPDPSSPPSSGGVRRHHTISASSRAARNSARETISEEAQEQQLWNDDEVVDEDWVGGVGAVGEKTSSLHRQSSLPTRYHRALHKQTSKTGSVTPKTLNSLSAIAGHEGDEEDWEREIRVIQTNEDQKAALPEHAQHQQVMEAHAQAQAQSSNQSPLTSHFGPGHVPSPPPAASGVRRHQSLTYGHANSVRQQQLTAAGLKRSGTLQAQNKHSSASQSQGHHSPSPTNAEEDHEYDDDPNLYEEETYFPLPPAQPANQYPSSPMGRSSPWNTSVNDRRNQGFVGPQHHNNPTIDDVQRALSTLEIASHNNQLYPQDLSFGNYQGGQSAHPPRFNSQPSPSQSPGMRSNNGAANGNGTDGNRKLQLVTDLDGRRTPSSQNASMSGSSYPTPMGLTMPQHQQYQNMRTPAGSDDRSGTAGTSAWEQKDRILTGRISNPNLQYGYQQGQAQAQPGKGIPNVPSIPQQYLQHQGGNQSQAPRLGAAPAFGQGQAAQGGMVQPAPQGFVNVPIDVPSLIATKGYNPSNFDVRPQFARFFVIKSYTEDDVHKSLKYEIWSSTDPGNKRLDKAFKETANRGPIYLFFSVNASGHFCGMAEMLTPVDYTRSSTVWASDKWKGVFKVRWVFVRDIPNVNLRHIKLNNTQERKPVTNSRDTQELLPDAGQEMLRIFHTHPARTSLLQDFAFYELQAMQKLQSPGGPSSPTHQTALPPIHSPSPQSLSPSLQQAAPYNNANTMAAFQMSQMTPMMQMQMQMNMGMNVGSQFSMPQTQAMHQSVMRHPSPQPPNQGFMGMPGF